MQQKDTEGKATITISLHEYNQLHEELEKEKHKYDDSFEQLNVKSLAELVNKWNTDVEQYTEINAKMRGEVEKLKKERDHFSDEFDRVCNHLSYMAKEKRELQLTQSPHPTNGGMMNKSILLETGISGLSISISDDGVWIYFNTEKRESLFNLNSFAQRQGHILGATITDWCNNIEAHPVSLITQLRWNYSTDKPNPPKKYSWIRFQWLLDGVWSGDLVTAVADPDKYALPGCRWIYVPMGID